MRFKEVLVVSVIGAVLVTGCSSGRKGPPASEQVTTHVLAAKELTRRGDYAGAESQLLTARSNVARQSEPWKSYTSAAADVAREAGQVDRACGLAHELDPGEIFEVPAKPSEFEPVGPRQRLLQDALTAAGNDDYAGAVERLERLRRDLDPKCPSSFFVIAAQAFVALQAGAMADFAVHGQAMDAFFDASPSVLRRIEGTDGFKIYVLSRALAGKPLPAAASPELRDRMAFFKFE